MRYGAGLSDKGNGALLSDDVLGAGTAVVDDVDVGALRAFDAVRGVAVPLEVEVVGLEYLPAGAVVDEDGEVLLLVGGEDAEVVVVGAFRGEGVGGEEGELSHGEAEFDGVGAVEVVVGDHGDVDRVGRDFAEVVAAWRGGLGERGAVLEVPDAADAVGGLVGESDDRVVGVNERRVEVDSGDRDGVDGDGFGERGGVAVVGAVSDHGVGGGSGGGDGDGVGAVAVRVEQSKERGVLRFGGPGVGEGLVGGERHGVAGAHVVARDGEGGVDAVGVDTVPSDALFAADDFDVVYAGVVVWHDAEVLAFGNLVAVVVVHAAVPAVGAALGLGGDGDVGRLAVADHGVAGDEEVRVLEDLDDDRVAGGAEDGVVGVEFAECELSVVGGEFDGVSVVCEDALQFGVVAVGVAADDLLRAGLGVGDGPVAADGAFGGVAEDDEFVDTDLKA